MPGSLKIISVFTWKTPCAISESPEVFKKISMMAFMLAPVNIEVGPNFSP
jgi:hypothetical protein